MGFGPNPPSVITAPGITATEIAKPGELLLQVLDNPTQDAAAGVAGSSQLSNPTFVTGVA